MRRIALIAAATAALLVVIVVVGASGSSVLAHYTGGTYVVRAIFDDASFAAEGEDVRIAGANVGSITGLGVTADKRAAVTLSITDSRFAPFYANATCAIRPQSLIGEEYVDCEPGSSSAPPLRRIASGPGAGSYLLPVAQTSSPIDVDIVQDISTMPVRQSLSVIIDELGTGLAARGSDLNAVIHRADPALGDTDQVLKILDSQDRALAQLAVDSDAVLAPLARERRQISDFIVAANTTSVASAARAADISRTFRLFPAFLAQLRPLLADLGSLAEQGTPLMGELGQSASALGRQFANLTPFAAKARTALVELGTAAQASQPSLVATQPLAQRLAQVGDAGQPTSAELDKLTASLNSTGGIEQLMSLLFNGTAAGNGFDSLGHYLRDEAIVSSCTNYATTPVPGCSADFSGSATSAAAASATSPAAAAGASSPAAAASATSPAAAAGASSPAAAAAGERVVDAALRAVPTATNTALHGLLSYLLGGGTGTAGGAR
ncbi:MAG: MlaD family protein [Solirubrobacteraceae bacterium]